MKSTCKLATYIVRPFEFVLGLVFLAGAVLKAADINLFAVQITHYGILQNETLIDIAAVGVLGIETFLATVLILGWQRRTWAYGFVTALLGLFTGLILYGWIFHDLDDCGCFGSIEMSPRISIIKNVLLLFMTLSAWIGSHCAHKNSAKQSARSRWAGWVVPTAAILAIVMMLYGYQYLKPAISTEDKEPIFAQFVFEEDAVDLGTGDYFVAILSTTCEHCIEETEKLNALIFEPDLPQIVALCEGDLETMEEFRDMAAPEFPTYLLDIRTFFSLIETEPPRFYLVHDGRPITFWDAHVPDAKDILSAMTGLATDSIN